MLEWMVGRRFVGVSVEMNGLGLFYGGVIAFLIIQRDRRLAFVEDAIRQGPALVEQGHGAVEGLADGGLDASEAIALALSCERVRSVLYWRVRFFVSLRWACRLKIRSSSCVSCSTGRCASVGF